jgi:hypothetical protein
MTNLKTFILLLLVVPFLFVSCNKDDDDSGPYYELIQLDLDFEAPYRINILFQVRDNEEVGIAALTADDFLIKEDGSEVGAESGVAITPTESVDIEVKTLLLLDNSKSVADNLNQIKTAAIALVDQAPDYQKMAVYTFSETSTMLLDFSFDKVAIKSAINSIEAETGASTTNLYGALIDASEVSMWTENFSIESIRTSNLICFTDGDDVAGIHTLQDAQTALVNKTIYMLGLGADLNESNMQSLGTFYSAENIDALSTVFLDIQQDIENTANSYYWLYYDTPKRGSNTYELRVEIRDNSNNSSTGFILKEFKLSDFN